MPRISKEDVVLVTEELNKFILSGGNLYDFNFAKLSFAMREEGKNDILFTKQFWQGNQCNCGVDPTQTIGYKYAKELVEQYGNQGLACNYEMARKRYSKGKLVLNVLSNPTKVFSTKFRQNYDFHVYVVEL